MINTGLGILVILAGIAYAWYAVKDPIKYKNTPDLQRFFSIRSFFGAIGIVIIGILMVLGVVNFFD